MKAYLIPALTLVSINSISFACSNAFITGTHVAAVARTMDLELNTGNTFGFGAIGWQNTSNINLPQKAPVKAAKWQNKYAFVGQSGFKTYALADGTNNKGLYAAFLDLPDISYYPTYNPQDKRPELGVSDVVNYVLGTAKDVNQALKNLAKLQIVKNAFELQSKQITFFGGNAVHVIMRDAGGNSALLEWTKVSNKPILHIYHYIAGSNQVIETIPGSHLPPKALKDTMGAILTNSPEYRWQLKNAAQYDKVFNGNTNQKWDGIYQNGSGMNGIPGSWTPISRFARGTQLIRTMPKPQTEQQALSLANAVIDTMKVPVGANPSATLWATLSDLKNHIYYFKPYLNSKIDLKTKITYINLPKFNSKWIRIDVNEYAKRKSVPKGWVRAVAEQGGIATLKQAAHVDAMIHTHTPGNIKPKIMWQHPGLKGLI